MVKQFSSKIVPAYEKTKKEHSDWIEQGGKLKSRAANEYKLYNKNEEELYENSRITFGIKDKINLNKLNITPNNLPKEKRIVLLNQSK